MDTRGVGIGIPEHWSYLLGSGLHPRIWTRKRWNWDRTGNPRPSTREEDEGRAQTSVSPGQKGLAALPPRLPPSGEGLAPRVPESFRRDLHPASSIAARTELSIFLGEGPGVPESCIS